LPWCPRFLYLTPEAVRSFGARYREQRMISDHVPGFGPRQCQGASPRKNAAVPAICA
jgi:hypothetical protein